MDMLSLKCLIRGHHRSGADAVKTGDSYVSNCRRCGVPMRRISRGNWEVVSKS